MNLIELARKLRPLIEKAAQSLDDKDASAAVELFTEWRPDAEYSYDFKIRRGNRVYRVIQPHTSQLGWEPENTPALYTGINVEHAGTLDDPIPYAGNMELTEGIYYTQYGETYICTRNTGAAVYHELSELVGMYVEKVERS